jgi:hypothetical protein
VCRVLHGGVYSVRDVMCMSRLQARDRVLGGVHKQSVRPGGGGAFVPCLPAIDRRSSP